MILAYRRSGILQAVTIIRDNPKSTLVHPVGEPNRKPFRVPKRSPNMHLFDDVDKACEYVGYELK